MFTALTHNIQLYFVTKTFIAFITLVNVKRHRLVQPGYSRYRDVRESPKAKNHTAVASLLELCNIMHQHWECYGRLVAPFTNMV